jgi:hypothetical protein
MKTRFKILIISICIFFTIFVISSTQLFYVFDGGILPIAIHSKTDIYKLENTPEQLGGIFSSCDCQERVKANPETNNLCTQPLIDWENSTHYIDNNLCKFITLEEHYEKSSDEHQYFFKVGDLFYWQNLQTGETIPSSGVLISILVSSLGPILIVLFIVIYAIKKRRKKKVEEKK